LREHYVFVPLFKTLVIRKSPMTTWVTGADGFIGRHLVRVLADRAHVVDGLGHGAIEDAERFRLGLREWLNGEIDAANLNALASRSGAPSAIFHLAGGSSVGLSITQPYEDFSRTVASTARLIEWIRVSAPQCHLIVVSSAAVYGSGHSGPISEDAALIPMSPYGQHKLMMEQLCRSYALSFGLRSTVVRLFSVYGPRLRKQLLWDVCCRLAQGETALTLGGTGAELRDWTDVRDVARLLTMIGELPRPESLRIVNGGSGRGTSVAEIANMLVAHWGGHVSVRFSGAVRAGDPYSLLADNARLSEMAFDWGIPIDQGLADYVSWFKDHAR
jgi:UDP-glucose 4-epimerase